MSTILLEELEQYWTRRAPSYSDETKRETEQGNEQAWMEVIQQYLPVGKQLKILDVGTGPGFLAIALAKQGYLVTAVDYTPAMLEQAEANAGQMADTITFMKMDAQDLSFPDDMFDAVVSRDLTWNLGDPERAYREWRRVLKPDGVMLNFDAGWYNYLFDDQKKEAFERDRDNVKACGVQEFNAYEEAARMEEIARRLILSRSPRPETDLRMLKAAGFSELHADTGIWRQVWDEVQQVNNASTPCFMLYGRK